MRELARVALAGREAVHVPLVTGVLSGGVPVALLADAGCNPLPDEADIARIVAEVLRRCLPEKDHEERRRARHELREVHESSLADGSVRRRWW